MKFKYIKLIAYIYLLSLNGCYHISPYSEPEVKRPGSFTDSVKDNIKEKGWGSLEPIFVTVPMAREYARELQDNYRDKIVTLSDERLITNSTLIGIAASALGIAATGGATSAIAALGVSGAGVSAIGSQLPNSTQKQIYTQGSLALECIINASNKSMKPIPTLGRMKNLRDQMSEWQNEASPVIEDLKKERASCSTELDKFKIIYEDMVKEKGILTENLDSLDPRGQILLSAVENMRFNVDDELSKAEPNLIAFNSSLKDQLSSAASGFTNGTPVQIKGNVAQQLLSTNLDQHQDQGKTKSCSSHDSVTKLIEGTYLIYRDIQQLDYSQAVIEPLDFSSCQMAKPFGNGTLRAEPSLNNFSTTENSNFSMVIRGGIPPYSTDKNLWPEKVDVKAGSALKDGQIFHISIQKGITKSFVLVFTDSAGALSQVTFLLEDNSH